MEEEEEEEEVVVVVVVVVVKEEEHCIAMTNTQVSQRATAAADAAARPKQKH